MELKMIAMNQLSTSISWKSNWSKNDNKCKTNLISNLILIFISSQELESLLQNEFMKADPSELSQTNLRLIEGTMIIRSHLLQRLSSIGKEEIKVCDVRVDQKSKLETFRGLLEDLLLRLVSNGNNQVIQLRWKVPYLKWYSSYLTYDRAIYEDLLSLRRKISSEIMRVVMLPERESDNLDQLGSGCEYCKVTQTNSVA